MYNIIKTPRKPIQSYIFDNNLQLNIIDFYMCKNKFTSGVSFRYTNPLFTRPYSIPLLYIVQGALIFIFRYFGK